MVVIEAQPVAPPDLVDICSPLSCARHDRAIEKVVVDTDPRRVENMRHRNIRRVEMNVHEHDEEVVLRSPLLDRE